MTPFVAAPRSVKYHKPFVQNPLGGFCSKYKSGKGGVQEFCPQPRTRNSSRLARASRINHANSSLRSSVEPANPSAYAHLNFVFASSEVTRGAPTAQRFPRSRVTAGARVPDALAGEPARLAPSRVCSCADTLEGLARCQDFRTHLFIACAVQAANPCLRLCPHLLPLSPERLRQG